MSVNAYFELVNEDDNMWLKVHPPEENGEMFEAGEVVTYLNMISFPVFDSAELGEYINDKDFERMLLLSDEPFLPERERCKVTIQDGGLSALARFYPPSTGGGLMTEDDIVSDLRMAGIKHGIKRKAIQHFLNNHEYCRDYIIAEATPPVQGSNASIRYFFDANTTAKPKLNDDGSVDFHQLGMLKMVNEGDKLATLTPADRGRPGISVTGAKLNPMKVNHKHLRYGRNIRISDDKCNIYSMVSGQVTLVDDMVMVSDVYQVPANVDFSTGDIDFNGTVEVAGNVSTGFTIRAEGDIIVNGAVEGATLISGGNIILKRGMQGMDRGQLEAAGNITAKFLENCKVTCKGSLKADAVLHSQVECQESIDVLGKKGLITGGTIRTYGEIHATTLGSTMGTMTNIEIISEQDLIKRAKKLKGQIEDKELVVKKMDKVADGIKKQMEDNQDVLPEQLDYIKKAVKQKPSMLKEIRELKDQREKLLIRVEKNKNASIKVEDAVYSGVRISVKDATRVIHDNVSHCRFIREGADVRLTSL